MPEPIIEPTTSVVELKSPSDWTIWGFDWGFVWVEVEAGVAFERASEAGSGLALIGIVTWIGFTGFLWKSLVLSSIGSGQSFHPAP
jgi:hypothetical protein